jgi:hypothetical protein
MSQASSTIVSAVLTATLMAGCTLAPRTTHDDSSVSSNARHGESLSSESAASSDTRDPETESLAALLRELRYVNPARYQEAKQFLYEAENEVQANLRHLVREQFAALLQEEVRRYREEMRGDDIALTPPPTSQRPADNPRLLNPDLEFWPPSKVTATESISTSVGEPQAHPVEPAEFVETVAHVTPQDAELLAPQDTESGIAVEQEDLTMGRWREHLNAAIDSLEKELVRFDLEEEEAARWDTCLRLLYVVGNQRDQAVQPIETLTDDERDYWKHLLYGLLVSLDADEQHVSSRRAALALRDLRAASDHLSNISTLDVKGLTFCPQVYSFGHIVEYDSQTFQPGQEVLLYVEVDNFAVHKNGDQYETHLNAEYSIFDSRNVRVANVVLPSDRQLCNNRRRDYFIAYPLIIPADLPDGTYTLQLTIEDVVGKKSNLATIDFHIRD